ncbi:hypothetical protein [Nocardia huaxiensis]|uniref:Uncharacterized protein n=1 Tax=Nocardia huaxiensis TaxID=2755382 RepID=A0A7D6VHN2_9NOCA|nr:hypothetical protein [Nocardia huaxiensis]QLY33097.1 hypothetical protein H0264_13440 [Nocardia huaxiensis]UFS93133.1 hypothetical protein LPY97_19920 [Nocardia huaxiensis]
MTRAHEFSTFRVPQVPHGLLVLLTGLALIGGMVILMHLASSDAGIEPASHPGSATTAATSR